MERKKRNMALFTLYCAVMLWLLFCRRGTFDGMNLNLEPFRTLERYIRLLDSSRPGLVRLAVVNLFGNVIMFIPLGFFLPRVFGWLGKFRRTLLAAAFIITLVELAQLLTLLGCCDIDDLLLNLLGTAMGYGLHKLIK